MADRPSLPPAEQGLTADNTLMTEVTGFYRKFVALSDQFGRFTNRVGNLYLEVGIEFELYRVN